MPLFILLKINVSQFQLVNLCLGRNNTPFSSSGHVLVFRWIPIFKLLEFIGIMVHFQAVLRGYDVLNYLNVE